MTARHSDVALRAYYIWESEGRPEGKALDDWLRAEAECAAELILPRTARRAGAKRTSLSGSRKVPAKKPAGAKPRKK